MSHLQRRETKIMFESKLYVVVPSKYLSKLLDDIYVDSIPEGATGVCLWFNSSSPPKIKGLKIHRLGTADLYSIKLTVKNYLQNPANLRDLIICNSSLYIFECGNATPVSENVTPSVVE